MTGNAVALSEVNDPVFSGEMMGKGIAVIPTIGKVFAPVTGEIVSIFPTKHAITIKGTNGVELIIHVGLDTVNLKGEHFECKVTDGQSIKAGDLLLEFDIAKIKAAGYDIITPVIVLNTKDYEVVEAAQLGSVEALAELVKIEK
jgi:PTS system beta-glucosides-specific IIC component